MLMMAIAVHMGQEAIVCLKRFDNGAAIGTESFIRFSPVRHHAGHHFSAAGWACDAIIFCIRFPCTVLFLLCRANELNILGAKPFLIFAQFEFDIIISIRDRWVFPLTDAKEDILFQPFGKYESEPFFGIVKFNRSTHELYRCYLQLRASRPAN